MVPARTGEARRVALPLGKGMHGGDGLRLAVVGAHVHGLHAQALIDAHKLHRGEVEPLLSGVG